jgi:hypothetical protein
MPTKGGEVAASLRWLAKQQAPNGSFAGLASASASPFQATRRHENCFFTSLILTCLQGIGQDMGIVQKGVQFLKTQQSDIGSWNYWVRDSSIAKQHPLPDDLDDTAYALLALSVHEPSYVDGGLLAKLAKLLIASETQPGGPYRTWLVGPSQYGPWGDVDLAVNANIGGLLALQGVRVPALETYVSQQLAKGDMASRYYSGSVPSLYFLSRWYRGDGLKKAVARNLRNLNDKSSIEVAMLLTAGCRLNVAGKYLEVAYQRLAASAQAGHWPACGLYIELTVGGTVYYAGAEALTTAFAIEAINLYKSLAAKPAKAAKSAIEVSGLYGEVVASSVGLPQRLRKEYLKAAWAIIQADTQGQITDMAGLAARAIGVRLNGNVRNNLNLGSLNGWIAYSIYDDFFDQEAELQDLAVANHALRQTLRHYLAALPRNVEYQKLIYQALDTIDAANQWEVTNTRAAVKGPKVYAMLPKYGNYAKLAERSWGHMLSATGVLMSAGYGVDSPQVSGLQKFFYHYLIARQLNDDAHDWLEDLSKGHISAVVSLLLKEFRPEGAIDLKNEQKDLQVHFWQHTIDEVAALANTHLRAARRALSGIGIDSENAFDGWLNNLEESTQRALTASHETRKFIKNYKNS